MVSIASAGIFLFLIPTILIITLVIFYVYKKIYDKHTNKVFKTGDTNNRKMLAPWGLALIVFCAQLILVAGFIFPIYMFAVDNAIREPNVELTSDMPLSFSTSDTEQFKVDDKNYKEITTLSKDGIKITVYKYLKSKNNDYYIFLGEIDKERNYPMSIYLKYDNADNEASLMCEVSAVCNSDKAFFMCETIAVTDTPASLWVGIKNRSVSYMSSEDMDFDKDVKLVF